jgi:hypothetical protein
MSTYDVKGPILLGPAEHQHARIGSIICVLLNDRTCERCLIHLLIRYRTELVRRHLSSGVLRVQDAFLQEASTDPVRPALVSYAPLLAKPNPRGRDMTDNVQRVPTRRATRAVLSVANEAKRSERRRKPHCYRSSALPSLDDHIPLRLRAAARRRLSTRVGSAKAVDCNHGWSADDRVGQGGEGCRAWDRLDLGDAGRASSHEVAADAGDLKRLLGPSTEAEDWPLRLPTAGLQRRGGVPGGLGQPSRLEHAGEVDDFRPEPAASRALEDLEQLAARVTCSSKSGAPNRVRLRR